MKQILVVVLVSCFMLTSCGRSQQDTLSNKSETLNSSQVMPAGAQFTGIYSVSAEDPNKDKKYDFISTQAEIKITKEGEYDIYGSVFFKGVEVTSRPFARSAARSHYYLSAKPGVETITLNFSGQDIYEERKNGKYTVEMIMIDASGDYIDRILFETPHFKYTDFREVY